MKASAFGISVKTFNQDIFTSFPPLLPLLPLHSENTVKTKGQFYLGLTLPTTANFPSDCTVQTS
jgi:hypothetical protein